MTGVDARRDEIDAAISAPARRGLEPRRGSTGRCARSCAPAPTSCSPGADVPVGIGDHRICRRRPGLLRQARERLRQRPARRHRQGSARPRASAGGLMNEAEVDRPAARARDRSRGARAGRRCGVCSTGWSSPTTCIAEGVHFLPGDPPGDVGWKLVAVNLSDLAAKGATPAARAAVADHRAATATGTRPSSTGSRRPAPAIGLPLLGGDTIALPAGAPRVLRPDRDRPRRRRVPRRAAAARPGDRLWVIGTIGDSAAGLAQLAARSRRPPGCWSSAIAGRCRSSRRARRWRRMPRR